MRKNSEAAPAIEMPMDIMTALVMLMMRSFFRRFFRAVSCFWAYSFRIAFISSRNWVMMSFRPDFFSVKVGPARFVGCFLCYLGLVFIYSCVVALW